MEPGCEAHTKRSESGFTLVELLVVMLILAMLAAVAIPAFFKQSDKARDAAAKAAARTAETAAEVLATDNNGKYSGPDGVTVANLQDQEETLNAADLSVSGVSAHDYTVTVTSLTGNEFSVMRKANGTTELTCAWPGADGCPASGRWG
jgi:type IV pilus assembly protein PilA